jgi:transposase
VAHGLARGRVASSNDSAARRLYGKGHPWLAATLGEIGTAAARTDTFLGERYHRIARRRGKRRVVVALGNSVLTIIWNLLSDP